MTIEEFRSKIKPDMKLFVDNMVFEVKEVVRFKFDDNTFYIKCFLNNDYIFADDSSQNVFLLVKEVKTPFKQPFPETIEYNNKEFNFLYTAHAIAEDIKGQEIFKKGEKERFWDYKSKEGDYLSLGINDKTNKRSDFYGKVIHGSKNIRLE